jgi:hypothetical protein
MSKYKIIFVCTAILFSCKLSFLGFAQTPKYKMGCLFDTSKYAQVPLKAALLTREYNILPPRSSLKNYCPTPKSQGEYGTCTAWAVAYSARTIIEAKQNNLTFPQQVNQQAFSPFFTYTMVKSDFDEECIHGAHISKALETMKNNGTVKYNDFQNACASKVPSFLLSKAKNFKIKSYLKLFTNYDNQQNRWLKISAVKKSLSEGKPVIIGMKCPSSFHTAKNCWIPKENPLEEYNGHAMTVIGYDDSKFGGAFEIMNSWGTDWGNQGFIWVRYQDFANFVQEAYEMIEIPSSNTLPATSLSADLSGKLKIITASGEEIKATWNGNFYKVGHPLEAGTRFRLYFSNNEPAYVYIFASDNQNHISQIFPYKAGVSPALTSKKSEIAIPDEEHYLVVDAGKGTDYLCVIYSKEMLDIQSLKNKLEKSEGYFIDKIQHILASKLVATKDISYKTNEIAFSAISKGKETVLLTVEISH